MCNITSSLVELQAKADWVRRETLLIHKKAPETRIASSLSCVEIFTVLFYGGIIRCRPDDPSWEDRDRLIISKGHGSVCFYPILADLGYFTRSELDRVCMPGSFLGGIPDPIIPGFETVNGSLGHGLGVGCGVALGLKAKHKKNKVFVLMGDGELYEGAVWEAIMFAGEHSLGNLTLIIDDNKICLLDFCEKIINLNPLDNKFSAFRWKVASVDGHDISRLCQVLEERKNDSGDMPNVIIANTIKGKGVPRLEGDPLNHIKTLSPEEIDQLIQKMS